MGARQYIKTYELIIGNPSAQKGLRIIGSEKDNTGVQLKFSVKKNLDNKDKSNSGEITLLNLSESTINYIQKKNLAVVLKTGYDGDNKVLFSGIINEIVTDDNTGNADKQTVLRCIPSDSLLYSPTISRSFPAGSSPRTIISYLIAQETNLTQASFNSDNIDLKFPFGYPAEGSVKEILNELSRDFNFHYRVDGNRLYVSDPGRYESDTSIERAFVISSDTGLIGVPTKATSDGKRYIKDKSEKDGVKFKALINALLRPGQAVSLKGTEMDGVYRINTAEFNGDWRGETWEVTCHCSKINATEV